LLLSRLILASAALIRFFSLKGVLHAKKSHSRNTSLQSEKQSENRAYRVDSQKPLCSNLETLITLPVAFSITDIFSALAGPNKKAYATNQSNYWHQPTNECDP
jgi:hypothetical protein